jgi:hypothetical protein
MVFLGATNPVTMQLLILTIWPHFYHLIFLLFQIPQTILLWDISPVLNFIHRQSDTTLIKCINALEKGNVSNEDVAFINSLSRSLENEEKCVHLF